MKPKTKGNVIIIIAIIVIVVITVFSVLLKLWFNKLYFDWLIN